MRCVHYDFITQEYLRKLLDYDPNTGILIWKVDRGRNAKRGNRAGWITPKGYRKIELKGHNIHVTNLIWLLMTGGWPELEVDHKNKVRDDNRWENLRLATGSQQKMNNNIYKNNTSGCAGVAIDRNLWRARISINGKRITLGRFKDKNDAISAYEKARLEMFGEFA